MTARAIRENYKAEMRKRDYERKTPTIAANDWNQKQNKYKKYELTKYFYKASSSSSATPPWEQNDAKKTKSKEKKQTKDRAPSTTRA